MIVAFLPHRRMKSTPKKPSLVGVLALFALQICLSITPLMPWFHAAQGDALCTSNGWVYQSVPAEIAAALNPDATAPHCTACLAGLQTLPVIAQVAMSPALLWEHLAARRAVALEQNTRYWMPLVRAPPAAING